MSIDAMINIENNIFRKRFQETETSEAVAAAAPEHVIDIGYNGDEVHLTESEELISGLGHIDGINYPKDPFKFRIASFVEEQILAGASDHEIINEICGNDQFYDRLKKSGDPKDIIENYIEDIKYELESKCIWEDLGNTTEKVLIDEGIDDDLENSVLFPELKERRDLINKTRQLLKEAIKNNRIEEINNEEKPLGKCRYKLQKFTNGGTPYVDEEGTPRTDGEKGGPSSYEQWRYEMNDKKRTARLKQERDDANSSFHGPRITQADPEGTIDSQIDQYLAQYVKDHEDPEDGVID